MKIGFLLAGILAFSCCSPRTEVPASANFQLPSGELIPLNAETKPASNPPTLFHLPATDEGKKPDLKAAPPKPEIAIKPKANSDLRMRLPDMLALPEDSQLRSAPSKEPANKAGIIARPPAE